jgi:release factor glutamine methyltransferase
VKQPTTVREAFIEASSFLKQQNIDLPQETAERIILHVLNWSKTEFLTRWDDPIAAEMYQRYEAMIKRKAAGEPLQYICGEQEFYGLRFTVGKGVLIPRPETEILVEKVLSHAEALGWGVNSSIHAADIGTGSGAIAITLAHERRQWKVTTVDISHDALLRAADNARLNDVEDQIHWVYGNLTEPLEEKGVTVDVLVSNPPYIPSREIGHLQREVREYEPRLALDGGMDGLDFYRRIADALPKVLRSPGLAAFEVGVHQAEQVKNLLLQNSGVKQVMIYPDYQGIPRVVIGIR